MRLKVVVLIVGALLSVQVVQAQSKSAERNWIDDNHQSARAVLQDAADEMNSWFGEPKASDPAMAQLRVIFDNRWNRYDGYSIKPRIRGKIRLPTLRERLNLVFGDDSVDDEWEDNGNLAIDARGASSDRKFDVQQTKRDNSSVGLQWVVPREKQSMETKFSIGLRSRGDVYAKMKMGKDWYYEDDTKLRAELIYRYGVKSKHWVRTNFGVDYAPTEAVINSNWFYLDYRNDGEDKWGWGNTLSRRHLISESSWFNYGVYTGGRIEDDGMFFLDTYGPFIGMRSSIYRDWFFVQPELTYYNDEAEDRSHHLGVMLRFEVVF